MQDTVIKVSDIKKSFKLPHSRSRSVKGLFINFFRKRKTYEKQKVLRGISFEVKKGEFFGIVGRNGGGKSTLLKLLAGIYVPDSGSIAIEGKLTPFIELGVGFNPELTGRENVYLNGALLGFSRKEMNLIYDDIVNFAELEKFMDQKLRNYSSGMQVRLAFSVAIQAKTDILLIDEVLAVGDSNFQKKCFDVFEQFKKEGRTVIFISHSMDMVQRFCDRVIMIDSGQVVAEGSPQIVATEYEIRNSESQKNNKDRLAINNPREAKIVNTVLQNFGLDSEHIEIGSSDGRNVRIISSLGYKIYGIDPQQQQTKPKDTFFKTINQLKNPKKVKGLMILDSRKSISMNYLRDTFEQLESGDLSGIERIYIHLPFHKYQIHSAKKNPKINSHLGDPLELIDISKILSKYGFVQISSEIYGLDEPAQYNQAVFDRFSSEKQDKLWA